MRQSFSNSQHKYWAVRSNVKVIFQNKKFGWKVIGSLCNIRHLRTIFDQLSSSCVSYIVPSMYKLPFRNLGFFPAFHAFSITACSERFLTKSAGHKSSLTYISVSLNTCLACCRISVLLGRSRTLAMMARARGLSCFPRLGC